MAIFNLKVNHLTKPLGIFIIGNVFSFLSDEDGPFTASIYHQDKVLATKEVSLEECHCFSFGNIFEPGEKYIFEVKDGSMKAALEFETAIELKAPFIKPADKNIFSPIFQKRFPSKGKIKEARLYITGLGLYVAYLNGEKVGDRFLAPGCNDYDGYLRYQTYDVTAMLKEENVINVHMGDGWYKGRFGIDKPVDQGGEVFGSEYKLCACLRIDYEDGRREDILTDNSWSYGSSHEKANSIYDGEYIDYSTDLISGLAVVESEENYHLTPDFGPGIVIKDRLKPTLYISPKGEKILDFHQNLAGFVRMHKHLEKGQKVTIVHGEVLQQDCFYRDNLRTAKAEAIYVGDGVREEFIPSFTYFGFRYALIEGLEEVDPSDFEADVLYTDLEKTFECETDNPKINQLIHNAFWGQRGNFLDVPTDCPQRDERLGWTADTQVFVNTACYQMDTYNFYKKYLHDLRVDQEKYYEGDLPMYSPSLKHEAGNGGAVWADAGTIIPWNLYLNYGDKDLLGYSYQIIRDYVETLIEKDKSQGNRGLILYGFTFGDWLAQDGVCAQSLMGGTDNGFIMSVYYYNSVKIASLTAKELGNKEDEERYKAQMEKIYQAILDEYFAPNGKLALDTQTAYVLSLHFGIYRDKNRIIADFKERLRKDFYRMKTGFTGTPLILPCLFDNGMDDDAYRILYNEECPGWIYAINLGATTIWERWNSLLPDGTISGTNMNSLNHYSYGSVCEAIYSRIVGLKNLVPGWKKVAIEPHLNYRMKHVRFKFASPSGTYEVKWQMENDEFVLNVVIPHGCKATVKLPDGKECEVEGGEYRFVSKLPESIIHPFNLDTPNLDILNNPQARDALKVNLPRAYAMVTGENDEFKINNGRFMSFLAMFGTSKETMEKYEQALLAIHG